MLSSKRDNPASETRNQKHKEKMKITVYISEGDLDPNMTAADSAQSLANYKDALSAAINERFADADITFHDVSSDGPEFSVTGVGNDDDDIIDELETIASKIYDAGNFWA